MRKNRNNRPPEVGARGLLRLRCPCCGYIPPRFTDVHRLPLRGHDLA